MTFNYLCSMIGVKKMGGTQLIKMSVCSNGNFKLNLNFVFRMMTNGN